MGQQVSMGAPLQCSFGSAPSSLVVLPAATTAGPGFLAPVRTPVIPALLGSGFSYGARRGHAGTEQLIQDHVHVCRCDFHHGLGAPGQPGSVVEEARFS